MKVEKEVLKDIKKDRSSMNEKMKKDNDEVIILLSCVQILREKKSFIKKRRTLFMKNM